jgi:Ca2+-binding EF-hand superfamily protein
MSWFLVVAQRLYAENYITHSTFSILKELVLDGNMHLLSRFDFLVKLEKPDLAKILTTVCEATLKSDEAEEEEVEVKRSEELLELTERDKLLLKRGIIISGFDSLGLYQLWAVFKRKISYGLGLNVAQYRECVDELAKVCKGDSGLLRRFMMRLFHLLDRTKKGVAAFTDVISGLAVLCKGSQKDKLLFSFELLDKQGKRAISSETVFEYIYSCSAAITAMLQESIADRDKTVQEGEAKIEQIKRDRDAVWSRANALFTEAQLDFEQRNMIDHSQFSQWSNNPGSLLIEAIGDVWELFVQQAQDNQA